MIFVRYSIKKFFGKISTVFTGSKLKFAYYWFLLGTDFTENTGFLYSFFIVKSVPNRNQQVYFDLIKTAKQTLNYRQEKVIRRHNPGNGLLFLPFQEAAHTFAMVKP